jgi:hypothetical protein
VCIIILFSCPLNEFVSFANGKREGYRDMKIILLVLFIFFDRMVVGLGLEGLLLDNIKLGQI